MTGWRLGYCCGPEAIIEQMTKIHQYAIMCAPTNSQYAAVEAMKTPYLGKNGHIAVGTTDVAKAVEYLESQGVEFDMETAKYKNDKMIAVYIKEEIGGFAVHLVQK